MKELLQAADVARRLGVTPARVRQMAKEGKLPFTTTVSGWRLYDSASVDALSRARKEKKT